MTINGPPVLTVDVVPSEDGVAAVVSGDIDMSTADDLVGRVKPQLDDRRGVLTIDFAGVRFCDSAGINGLVTLRTACDQAGWEFRLTNVQPHVRRVLVDLTGLGEFLNVTP